MASEVNPTPQKREIAEYLNNYWEPTPTPYVYICITLDMAPGVTPPK
jgi:hypothetical protein